jgi:hypothetical protein
MSWDFLVRYPSPLKKLWDNYEMYLCSFITHLSEMIRYLITFAVDTMWADLIPHSHNKIVGTCILPKGFTYAKCWRSPPPLVRMLYCDITSYWRLHAASNAPNVTAPDDRRVHSKDRMATGGGKLKSCKKNLSQSDFLHRKSHMHCPRIEPGPPWCEADDSSPELWCHNETIFNL